jgi:predicted NAD/FAD-binding protein
VALQLTNILRDLAEDARRGRVYLPLDDLAECGYPVDELLSGRATPGFDRLMALQTARAERFYRQAAELTGWLHPDGRRVFAVILATYRALLRKIERRPRDVLTGRVRLSGPAKLWIACRHGLLGGRRKAEGGRWTGAGMKGSRHTPCAVRGGCSASADGTRRVPATVAVIGGGLAGMAAAVAAARRGLRVELFERRERLGGRAGSQFDPQTGRWLDRCPHVALGCCTSLVDFLRDVGLGDRLKRQAALHFFGPEGRQYEFCASRWLPAPLHLLLALMRLGFLSRGERWGIARAVLALARTAPADHPGAETMGRWLRRQGQTRRAVESFWSLLLESALGDTVERVSVAAARKVFVDGLLRSRRGYEMLLPEGPWGELWQGVGGWLTGRGARIHLGTRVVRIEPDAGGEQETAPIYGSGPAGASHQSDLVPPPSSVDTLGATAGLSSSAENTVGQANRGTRCFRPVGALAPAPLAVLLSDGSRRRFDFVVAAVAWRQVRPLLAEGLLDALPGLAAVEDLRPSPITAVHLWFDRPVCPLPHAALVGRLSQWVFRDGSSPAGEHHCQVVVSASHALAGRRRNDVLAEVLADLAAVWPVARQAQLLHWRIITRPAAVFSAAPGSSRLRPGQRTAVPNLLLAGDWTATGWPATMEGAVRSGRLAAAAILESVGKGPKRE